MSSRKKEWQSLRLRESAAEVKRRGKNGTFDCPPSGPRCRYLWFAPSLCLPGVRLKECSAGQRNGWRRTWLFSAPPTFSMPSIFLHLFLSCTTCVTVQRGSLVCRWEMNLVFMRFQHVSPFPRCESQIFEAVGTKCGRIKDRLEDGVIVYIQYLSFGSSTPNRLLVYMC